MDQQLEPVKTVLDRLEHRAKQRRDVFIDDPFDLHLRFVAAGVGEPEDRFYMTIEGKDLPMTQGALITAGSLIGQKNPNWFRKFADPDYFSKSFRNFNHKSGFMIRHDKREILAVLPESYRIMDSYDLLSGDFIPMLENEFGEIEGIQHLMEGDGDSDTFRIVGSDNIIPGVEERLGQKMMFFLSTSENGLHESRTGLGLYRPASVSMAIRGQTVSKWGHRNSPDTFLSRTAEFVRGTTTYRNIYANILQQMTIAPMPIEDERGQKLPVSDVLNMMKRLKLISRSLYGNASVYVNQLNEAGAENNTQYDLFVVCCRGAADITNTKLREKAEARILKLFTSKGGLAAQLELASEDNPDYDEDE